MFRIKIIPFVLFFLLISGCHKENGRHVYEMRLTFDSGDVFTDYGKIFEKYRNNQKYKGQIKDGFSIKSSDGKAFYIEVFNGYIFVKTSDKKLICSDQIYLDSNSPVAFANGQSGSFKGDIYFEGTYTQKGRAYAVKDGTFEFIWRNMETGQPVNSIVYKGKWTLER